jgi:transposase
VTSPPHATRRKINRPLRCSHASEVLVRRLPQCSTSKAFYRHFGNRREVAAYAGLAPTPWRSGTIDREQGISKAGNPRLRHIMVELGWLWVRHQPDSALAHGFRARVGPRATDCIVALARKLLIALWRYVNLGPEGAVLKSA